MPVIFLLLILSFLVFFVITRKSTVRVIKEENLRIEFHMQIIALVISPKGRQRDKGRRKKTASRRNILAALRRLIKHSKVAINKLHVPFAEIRENSITAAVRRRILSAMIISYLETMAEEIYLSDNAIILSPDLSSLQYDVSIESRLYQIIYNLTGLAFHILKEKIHVRE